MKYLILLSLLVSCGNEDPLYKAGDCIRIYINRISGDFLVREVFKDKYVLSLTFKHKGVASYTSEKYIYPSDQLEDNSRKINCEDVE